MKKLLAMLLILALMLSLTPAAFADELPEESVLKSAIDVS